jgi:glutathione S-transferase
MKVTQGYTLELKTPTGAKWLKGDVLVEEDDIMRLLAERGADPEALRLKITEQHAYQILRYDALFFNGYACAMEFPNGSEQRKAYMAEANDNKAKRDLILDKYAPKPAE